MNFISTYAFDLKQGKAREFQEWLSGNEEKLAAEAPDGFAYIGTYAVVQTSEKDTGSFKSFWRLDNYGAMDTFSAAMKDGGTFARLMEEMTSFMDQDNDANWSAGLYRKVTDAAIWGDV